MSWWAWMSSFLVDIYTPWNGANGALKKPGNNSSSSHWFSGANSLLVSGSCFSVVFAVSFREGTVRVLVPFNSKRIVASGCQEYLHHSAVFHGPSLSDLVSRTAFYVEGHSIFISVAVTRPRPTIYQMFTNNDGSWIKCSLRLQIWRRFGCF